MSNPIIVADQLSVSIAGTSILEKLSFSLEAGQLTGIIGPNGSGKTTLLRTISGILDYTGKLSILGKPIKNWDRKALARDLSVLPQNPVIGFDFKVWDYVMMGRLPHKGWLEHESKDDRQKVDQVLDALDLKGFTDRAIPSLSGGERQRVLLAQALAQDTSVLLLDEPTSHLDIYHQFDLLRRIRQLVDQGKSVIVVFHDLTMAARFTDELLVLKDGCLESHGKTSEILTEKLIYDVFRMSAQLRQTPGEPPHIYFKEQA